jgi:glutamine cyclotransferase
VQRHFISHILCLVAFLGIFAPLCCTPELETPARVAGDESIGSPSAALQTDVPVYRYRVIKTYPHDRRAFTQGLVYENGVLYESTGGAYWSPALMGQSTLRKVALETGKVLEMKMVPPQYFAEGIALFEERIIQLTWRAKVGLVYDKATLVYQSQFDYSTEGWGLTHDGEQLIMSDGSSTLRFWDPRTFEETGRLDVQDKGVSVPWINELEYIDGEIYANVWQSERIARISPETGRVLAWVDLRGLLSEVERGPSVDVLNGIAYDHEGKRLFVTGKGWPKLFHIELVPPK